jgi:hypothetical protein
MRLSRDEIRKGVHMVGGECPGEMTLTRRDRIRPGMILHGGPPRAPRSVGGSGPASTAVAGASSLAEISARLDLAHLKLKQLAATLRAVKSR